MRKAVNAVLSSRAYAVAAWELVIDLVSRINTQKHPLLKRSKEVKKIAIILISSNRGLCGGFNSQIVNKALRSAAEQMAGGKDVIVEWLAVGEWGAEFLARNGHQVVAQFEKPDVVLNASEVSALAKLIIASYSKQVYHKIFIAYTDFYSPMIQKPRIKQLLPFEMTTETELGSIGKPAEPAESVQEKFEYLFEPRPDQVLDQLLPHLVEVQLYQAFLESTASEHSARMMAMKNASGAAEDMIDDLTLAFNQARQAAITREIAEICGGKAALEVD